MTRINLLDWRSELRERQRKQFIGMMVLAVLLAVLTVGIDRKSVV
jgi:Tfp pilus assembly protein PilN